MGSETSLALAQAAASDAALTYAHIGVCFKAWDDGIER